ncbi:mannose-binding protein C-like [Parambassis ranga]|uniref:Mannose-binding protein C-like n=1 Tax=Parambassis ranga TaxID=210632 RepID=A0A6P7KA33_9TELE|nr:mannose-binding protein C-like [Parambassis ranga]
MAPCLLLCIFSLLALADSSSPGLPLKCMPGPSGNQGTPGLAGPAGPPGIPEYLGPVAWDIEALKKTMAKLDQAINFDCVRRVGQKYFVSNKERGPFQRAVQFCSQRGLELALPQNEEENRKLTQVFGEADKMAWINVKEPPLTFTKWGPGQPDGSVLDSGCTVVTEDGSWRATHDCFLNAYIVCQI